MNNDLIRKLDPQAKRLLYYLAQNKGQFIQADAIPIIGMEEARTVRVYVHRIREVLGKDCIRSARGYGYTFMGGGDL